MIVEIDLDETTARARSPHRPGAPPAEEDIGFLEWGYRKVAALASWFHDDDSDSGGTLRTAGFSFSRGKGPMLGKVSLDNAPEVTPAQATGLRGQLQKLDKHLLAHVEDVAAWRQRAHLSASLKAWLSALVSEATAAILDQDQAALMDSVMQFAQTDPRFQPLAQASLPAVERGNLLAAIRSPSLDAELHYLLHLAYAWRFNDADIFRQAVDSMRTGYAAEQRAFHAFRENQVVTGTREAGANRIGLMTANDEPRIRMNVNNFLVRMGCGTVQLVALVRQQFRILLAAHLSPELANKLVSTIFLTDAAKSVAGRKAADLAAWPNLPEIERRSAATRRWWDTLTMEKIREISLNDMFTGSLSPPTSLCSRHDPEFAAELARVPWMNALDEQTFPPVSDGKPLAQAIYQRFSAGAPEWKDYFTLARQRTATLHTKARAQRLLLLMVTAFGPLKEFEALIEPLVIDLGRTAPWDLYNLTLYCDIYRLSLAFQRKIDEQRLFNALLARLPEPPHGWTDFRDAAEHFILCLFLNGSPVRRFQLDRMLERTMRWLDHAVYVARDEKMTDELLTLLSFLEVGTLADLVPENLEQHQFQERRRALWLEHARSFAADAGFADWVKQASKALRSQTH